MSERNAEDDLKVCDAADPSEWAFGVDEDFAWCGPKSWGGCDMIEGRREDFADESDEDWDQFKKDIAFVAMSREALPYWIRRCVEAESTPNVPD